jgi:hypothetical protein
MGIARRKAGTVVRCPTCSGQVVVPTAEASTAQGDSSAPQHPAPVLFERHDFDQLFGPTTGEPRREEFPDGHQVAPAQDLALDVEVLPAAPLPAPPRTRPAGFYLSPLVATLLGVFFLLLVAVAFVAGYLVGGNGS